MMDDRLSEPQEAIGIVGLGPEEVDLGIAGPPHAAIEAIGRPALELRRIDPENGTVLAAVGGVQPAVEAGTGHPGGTLLVELARRRVRLQAHGEERSPIAMGEPGSGPPTGRMCCIIQVLKPRSEQG